MSRRDSNSGIKRKYVRKTRSSSSKPRSDFGSNANSDIVVLTKPCPVMTAPSIQPDPTTKILQRFLEISPLSGDYSLIDEYINVLDKLAAQHAASGARKRSIDELANEEATITLAIEGLPAEEKQHLATIAQACAKGIQADMATLSIATDMSAIQAAIETRNKEAEVSRQSVLGMMTKKAEELRTQLVNVHRKREAALEGWKVNSNFDTLSLQETKERLEKEGGMAMAVELGRRIERSESAEAKRN